MSPPKVGGSTAPVVTRPVADPPPPEVKTDAPQATAKVQDSFDSSNGPVRVEISKDHKISDAQLKEIAKKDPDLARSIKEAQVSYSGLLDKGAKIVATTSAGNGGKPVLTVVPPSLANNTDATKQYNVEVHYHGMDGRASKPNADSPVASRIADSFNKQPPTVYVLPEWKGTNDWSNVKNTGTTVTDATKGIAGAQGQLTVSAHSLGRKAVQSAIQNGGLKADKLDIQDAFYRTQPEGPELVAKWAKEHPDAKVRVLTTTGNPKNPSEDAMSDMKTIKGQAKWPSNVTFDDQSAVVHNHWQAELRPW